MVRRLFVFAFGVVKGSAIAARRRSRPGATAGYSLRGATSTRATCGTLPWPRPLTTGSLSAPPFASVRISGRLTAAPMTARRWRSGRTRPCTWCGRRRLAARAAQGHVLCHQPRRPAIHASRPRLSCGPQHRASTDRRRRRRTGRRRLGPAFTEGETLSEDASASYPVAAFSDGALVVVWTEGTPEASRIAIRRIARR